MKAKIPGGWRQNALRHSFISYRVAETGDVARTSLEAGSDRFYLYEFNAVLAALKKHSQVDARS